MPLNKSDFIAFMAGSISTKDVVPATFQVLQGVAVGFAISRGNVFAAVIGALLLFLMIFINLMQTRTEGKLIGRRDAFNEMQQGFDSWWQKGSKSGELEKRIRQQLLVTRCNLIVPDNTTGKPN